MWVLMKGDAFNLAYARELKLGWTGDEACVIAGWAQQPDDKETESIVYIGHGDTPVAAADDCRTFIVKMTARMNDGGQRPVVSRRPSGNASAY